MLHVFEGRCLLAERLGQLARSGLAVTINSDDPAYFGGYVAANLQWLAAAAGLDLHGLAVLVANGFEAAFALPGGPQRRREMVEAVWREAEAAEAAEAEVEIVGLEEEEEVEGADVGAEVEVEGAGEMGVTAVVADGEAAAGVVSS
ncbi:hypothetical protein PLESTF_000846700 [Pleodorina starrii]|nr:hypothetical protein PLESTF_000846700 [Pleodorina starrii]